MATKKEGTKREVTPDDLQGIPDGTHEPLKVENAKVVTRKKQTPAERLESRTNRHGAGRPPKFESPEAMQAAIDEYFDYCKNRSVDVFVPALGDHVTISKPAPYTMSGLALALDMSRQTLLDYSNRDEFIDTIRRAKLQVEHNLEERMNDKDTFTPGLIFNLKNNFGYVDKVENEHSMKVMPKPILSLPQLEKPQEEDQDDGQDSIR